MKRVTGSLLKKGFMSFFNYRKENLQFGWSSASVSRKTKDLAVFNFTNTFTYCYLAVEKRIFQQPFIRSYRLLFGSLLIVFLAACANTNQLYYWGNYEKLLYQMYNQPGEATPEVQVERLSEDIQRAEASGKRVPPGLYAHLGVMYASLGKLAEAETAFTQEKQLYPESAQLVDGMMQRAKKNWKSTAVPSSEEH